MALFVRKSRIGDWDRVTKETPEDGTFPADVLADILEGGNEVSVWEFDSEQELDVLIAALHSPEANDLSDMTFRFISDWKIKDLGLTKRKTQGDSVDPLLNKAGKHWVIEVNTVQEAIKLGKAFKDRESRTFSRPEVMRRFAVSVQQKRIPSEKIKPGLWTKLIRDGYVQVVAEHAGPEMPKEHVGGTTG